MADGRTAPLTTEPEPEPEPEEEIQSLKSRMILRERTAEQVNWSIIFLSVNIEFVAGIYAYQRIRSRNLSWKARAIRILPMFLMPSLATIFCSFSAHFARILYIRDNRLLEALRKECEEISPNDQVELLINVTPVTVPEMPSGLSMVEMTDPEMEPPVMIIPESASAGAAPVMGDSSFVTPLMVQKIASGHSIEEVSPNHQLMDDREMDPPVMSVQESPSLGNQELSMITDAEMPGSSIEESSVMTVQESSSVGGPSTVTPLAVPELQDAAFWRFLESNYRYFLDQAVDPVEDASEEERFFRLCHHPVLIYGGSMSFGFDKSSGAKCFMISARTLRISLSEDLRFCKWIARLDSRFSECVHKVIGTLSVSGQINNKFLTPNTAYAADVVFKMEDNDVWSFSKMDRTTQITIAGDVVSRQTWTGAEQSSRLKIWLRSWIQKDNLPSERPDGWLEFELGEFNSGYEIDAEVSMSASFIDTQGHSKGGFIVQGIEVKPKH